MKNSKTKIQNKNILLGRVRILDFVRLGGYTILHFDI